MENNTTDVITKDEIDDRLNTLDKVKKQLAEESNRRLEDVKKSSMELINEARNYNKVSEDAFKTYMLPYLTGEKELTKEVTSGWIEIAGGYTLPIDIIDNEGNVITTIPPLIDTDIVRKIHPPEVLIPSLNDFSNHKEAGLDLEANMLLRNLLEYTKSLADKVVNEESNIDKVLKPLNNGKMDENLESNFTNDDSIDINDNIDYGAL